MAKARITFDYNNSTGKRVIHVEYDSDPDMLAHEHEAEHRRIVGELVGRGVIAAGEEGDVVIDRPAGERENRRESGESRPLPPTPKAQLQE